MSILETISVVIPVFGRDDVMRTVAFLLAQEYADKLRIVVVDNGNAPELSGRIAGLKQANVQVVRLEENLGGSGGYIAGVEYCMREHQDTEIIWTLDDDAVPNAETLPRLVEVFRDRIKAGGKIASVGSVEVRLDDGDSILECGADFTGMRGVICRYKNERLQDHVDEVVTVGYNSGASAIVNKAAVRECGFWENVFIHLDDVEWGIRTTRRGWVNLATTKSVVRHPVVTGFAVRNWIAYYDTYNNLWICAKHFKLWFAIILTRVIIADIRNLLYRGFSPCGVYLFLARLDFLFGHRRLRKDIAPAIERLENRLRRWGRIQTDK